uniref:Alcohol dehydrogenase-like N-terminal domain-containing protein n=1 Tax=Oncorhynchus tshawytscha TaxID=74940 RepID=A0A8C8C5N5_ONCTS
MHLLRQLSCGQGSCLLIRRAPCVRTFLHGGQKRLFNTTSNSRMTIINDVFRFTKNAGLWTKEVILKVHAAGLNHIDASMRGGYGAATKAMKRDLLNINQSGSEFPLILGRDVSGVIIECFLDVVTHKQIGPRMQYNRVWAAIPPWKHGSLAEIVVLSANVPKFLSHTEVAAAPYVSVRAWSALVNTGGLNKDNCAKKHNTTIQSWPKVLRMTQILIFKVFCFI